METLRLRRQYRHLKFNHHATASIPLTIHVVCILLYISRHCVFLKIKQSDENNGFNLQADIQKCIYPNIIWLWSGIFTSLRGKLKKFECGHK